MPERAFSWAVIMKKALQLLTQGIETLRTKAVQRLFPRHADWSGHNCQKDITKMSVIDPDFLDRLETDLRHKLRKHCE